MDKTGMVYVFDIFAGKQNSHMINIAPDGSFECKVPMNYGQSAFCRMLKINENIYLEPGQTTFHYIDLNEYTATYRDEQQQVNRERKSLFMGDAGRINNDLTTLDHIRFINDQKEQFKILDMDAKAYKTYRLSILTKNQTSVTNLSQENPLGTKALQIKDMQLRFSTYRDIMSYKRTKEYAYRRKHKVPREQREIPLEKEELSLNYYDFIKSEELNNMTALAAGADYFILLNTVRYSEYVSPKANFLYTALKNELSKKGIELSESEKVLIDSLIATGNSRSEQYMIIRRNQKEWDLMMDKHSETIKAVDNTSRIESQNLKNNFGIDEGLVTDIFYAQTKSQEIKDVNKSFSDAEIQAIKANISNPFIVDYLVNYNANKLKEIAAIKEANKHKTGYTIHETPKTEADKVFDAIVEKYKGKVVFVDFWATWCGPCIGSIKSIKPLKEELADAPIEFVYITNQSSPLDTYNMMVPDIKGQHYRVSNDEWNYLSSKFNISGIPHFALVDKEGKVVMTQVPTRVNSELKKIFNKYL